MRKFSRYVDMARAVHSVPDHGASVVVVSGPSTGATLTVANGARLGEIPLMVYSYQATSDSVAGYASFVFYGPMCGAPTSRGPLLIGRVTDTNFTFWIADRVVKWRVGLAVGVTSPSNGNLRMTFIGGA